MKLVTEINIEDLFYPFQKPYKTGFLKVGDGHELYYQEYGNPKGVPVLIVHGGPGSGLPAGSKFLRTHDPKFFRIVALDQRGCGESKPNYVDNPKKGLYKNDPDHLAADFEKLRKFLGIAQWHVAGISWGTCLGLFYASKYPASVLSLTLGAIWMHSHQEINWFINYMGFFYPETEEKLLKMLPPSVPRFDRLGYLNKVITGKDKKKAIKLGEALGRFEESTLNFPPTAPPPPSKPTKKDLITRHRQLITLGALETYFMKEHPMQNQWFAKPQVKKAIAKIRNFHILQGRYDIICPPTTAFDLHRAHPHSKLTMIHYTGHGILRETNPLSQWMKACERLKY